jgi:hypothetical protein
MENKRLEQETDARQQSTPTKGGRNYTAALQRTEELHAISPAFRKISQTPVQPSPAQWRDFSRKLNEQLEASQAPYWQTVRDKIAASDGQMLHWLWILIALALLIIAAAIIALSLSEPGTAVAANHLTAAISALV